MEVRHDGNDAELCLSYRNCSVYLDLSIEEAFSMTIVEAIAYGNPVIVHKEREGSREISECMGFLLGVSKNELNLLDPYFLLKKKERQLVNGVNKDC